ncbi:MAG: hypothetical protein A3F90_10245 [Deltaproteobacteria bacterium RIFCSPLOWO2_12_FULL_60_19]|nr:MAG: hypothetical protein A3F90_10245 [Deltaproteobacteria bacterium RIFCSPLOWO2_12_FULL_60_19]
MNRQLYISCALLHALTLFSGTFFGAQAWESDVHYGLTKWLAINAGYDPQKEAELIARGNQEIDDSWITGPVHGTVMASCVGKDSAGSATVHDNHFPSRRDPPWIPSERAVTPATAWQHGSVRKVPDLDGLEPSLLALGRYLHVLQDSWSHQGVPDIAPLCEPKLGWGHSAKRGGWSCHLADLTYFWSDKDVPEMARMTFEVLVSSARNNKPLATWKVLAPKVKSFADARTKWQKDEWFKKESFLDRNFLQGISLPDCEPGARPCVPYAFEKLVQIWNGIVANDSPFSSDIPQQFADLFKRFFSALTQQQVSNLRELIDHSLAALALERALHADGSCPKLYPILFEFFLGKGFVDGRGAHQPLAVCEIAAKIQQERDKGPKCDELITFAQNAIAGGSRRGPALSELIERAGVTGPSRYTVTPGVTSGTYLAFARFIHLPREVLVVGAVRVNDQPKVTSFMWLPIQ